MVNVFAACAGAIRDAFVSHSIKNIEVVIPSEPVASPPPPPPPPPPAPTPKPAPASGSPPITPPPLTPSSSPASAHRVSPGRRETVAVPAAAARPLGEIRQPPPLGRLVRGFHEALSRLMRCGVLVGDYVVLNSAWDGHFVLSGAARMAQIVFQDGRAPKLGLEEPWARAAATACLAVALKFNSSCALDRLLPYVSERMTQMVTLHCLIFSDTGFLDADTPERVVFLDRQIRIAESHMVKRLQDILFKLLFTAPSNSVERLLTDSGEGADTGRLACGFVRNVACYACTLSHVCRDEATAPVRAVAETDEETSVATLALFVVACEAIALRHHKVELPTSFARVGTNACERLEVVELAVSVAELIRVNAGLLPVVAQRQSDVTCKRLIDFDTMSLVAENLARLAARLRSRSAIGRI